MQHAICARPCAAQATCMLAREAQYDCCPVTRLPLQTAAVRASRVGILQSGAEAHAAAADMAALAPQHWYNTTTTITTTGGGGVLATVSSWQRPRHLVAVQLPPLQLRHDFTASVCAQVSTSCRSPQSAVAGSSGCSDGDCGSRSNSKCLDLGPVLCPESHDTLWARLRGGGGGSSRGHGGGSGSDDAACLLELVAGLGNDDLAGLTGACGRVRAGMPAGWVARF
eukprot:264750-Chlamydomonas_euryale.AAC.2